ncbi:hypothetical protein AB0M11_32950 [Streptomyces sp. NPDC051987]
MDKGIDIDDHAHTDYCLKPTDEMYAIDSADTVGRSSKTPVSME